MPMIVLATVGGVLGIALIPPAIIVLASSSPSTYELVDMVGHWLFPLRHVALLDGQRIRVGRLPPVMFGPLANLRTSGDVWRTSVHDLVELVALVVLDTRVTTPAVQEEIGHMLLSSRLSRTLFVTQDPFSCRSLLKPAQDQCAALYECTYRALPAELARFQLYGQLEPQWRSLGRVPNERHLRVLVEKQTQGYKPLYLPHLVREAVPGELGQTDQCLQNRVLQALVLEATRDPSSESNRWLGIGLRGQRMDFFIATFPDDCRAVSVVVRQP
jgi:hypothetical protein